LSRQTTEPVRANEILSLLQKNFPELKVEYAKVKRLKVSVNPSQIKDVALFIRDYLGFDHISMVSGVDWIAKNQFEVVYFVETATRMGYEDFVIALSEKVPRDNPSVPSLVDVWPGVEYHERETFEMLGINFENHPNLKRFILPEDWNDIPPLRKDFISPGR
jgi:NADH:ubiquinone oxidoreductase subunit C